MVDMDTDDLKRMIQDSVAELLENKLKDTLAKAQE